MDLSMLDSLDPGEVALYLGAALATYALLQLALAFGLRRGTLAWGGHYPRRLPGELRARSFFAGLFLAASAWFIATAIGTIDLGSMPDRLVRSGAFVVASLLGVGALAAFASDSRWERFLFGPLLLFGAAFTASWAFF